MSKIFRPRGIESDGLKYYQEQDKAGDYLSVDPSTLDYYARIGQPGYIEARATAIHGDMYSVCTTSVHIMHLRKKCHRVRKVDIPKEWLEVL